MDKATVKKIAKLARLEIQEEEIDSYTKDLSNILKWIEQLSAVDTSKIGETTGIHEEILRFREDKVSDGNCREKVLSNAPQSDFNCFVVPKVIE